MFKSNLLKGVLASAMLLMGSAAYAEYPEKPVNFIVPWPPGDLEDRALGAEVGGVGVQQHDATAIPCQPESEIDGDAGFPDAVFPACHGDGPDRSVTACRLRTAPPAELDI